MEAAAELLKVAATVVNAGRRTRSRDTFFQKTSTNEPGVTGDVVI
jgi:hypothetical protein